MVQEVVKIWTADTEDGTLQALLEQRLRVAEIERQMELQRAMAHQAGASAGKGVIHHTPSNLES